MKNPHIIFLKKISILFIILLIIDIGLGKSLEYFFLKMKFGETSRTTYSINNSNQELLIFGSSRASHHYIPQIFTDSLQFSSYNIGTDGQGTPYYYCLLKAIMKRSVPKIIILDLNVTDFARDNKSYDRLAALLPYYKNHKEIQPIVNVKSKFESIKALSNLYRYNSYPLTIIVNNILNRKNEAIAGYIPLYKTLNSSLNTSSYTPETQNIDTFKTKYFRSFIEDIKMGGCDLYIFVSPIFIKYNNTSETVEIAKKICIENNISFRDYSQDEYFLHHPELFQDNMHLNDKGAVIYSKKICTFIHTR